MKKFKTFLVFLFSLMMMFPTAAFAKDYTYTTDNGKPWTEVNKNTFKKDLDGGGKVTLTKNLDGSWLYDFEVQDNTLPFYIFETMAGIKLNDGKSNWFSEGSDGHKATIEDMGKFIGKDGYTITNKNKDPKQSTKSFTVTKVVKNNGKDDIGAMKDIEFPFTVSITSEGHDVSGIKKFGDTIFVNGKAKFVLKNGETKKFTSLPPDVVYTITEDVKDDELSSYWTSKENIGGDKNHVDGRTINSIQLGTIGLNPLSKENDVYVVNDFHQKNVTLKKTVSRDDGKKYDGDEKFKIYMEVKGVDQDHPFIVDGDKHYTDSYVFSMGNGEEKHISFPSKAEYRFYEEGGDYNPSFTVTENGKEPVKGETGIKSSLSTEWIKENSEVVFNNEKVIPKVGDLKISKKIVDDKGAPSTDPNFIPLKFTVTVEMSGLEPGKNYKTSSGFIISDDMGKCNQDFFIKAGEEIVVYGVPNSAKIKITEQPNEFIPEYKLNGGDLMANGDDQTNKAITTREFSLDPDKPNTVEFINKSVSKTIGLKILKVNEKDQPIGPARYELYKKQGTQTINSVKIADVIIDKSGSSQEIKGLLPGNYYLVETMAPNGYSVSDEHQEFSLTDDQLGTTVTIKAKDNALEVLPTTGNKALLYVIVGGAAVFLSKIVLNLIEEKKEN